MNTPTKIFKHKGPPATIQTSVWRLFTHHVDRDAGLAWMRRNGRIAIGWGNIGDVRKFKSKDAIKTAIKDHYPSPPYRNNAYLGAPSLWDLCHEMKKGDLVILGGSVPRTLVVEVVGDYEYVKEQWPLEGEYQNQRTVQVTAYDANKLWIAAGQAPGRSRYQTLIQCANPVETNDL